MGPVRFFLFILYSFQVDLCIEPGQSLGLMIRGGVEYNLGIFITGVDKDSVADRAGLMVCFMLHIYMSNIFRSRNYFYIQYILNSYH